MKTFYDQSFIWKSDDEIISNLIFLCCCCLGVKSRGRKFMSIKNLLFGFWQIRWERSKLNVIKVYQSMCLSRIKRFNASRRSTTLTMSVKVCKHIGSIFWHPRAFVKSHINSVDSRVYLWWRLSSHYAWWYVLAHDFNSSHVLLFSMSSVLYGLENFNTHLNTRRDIFSLCTIVEWIWNVSRVLESTTTPYSTRYSNQYFVWCDCFFNTLDKTSGKKRVIKSFSITINLVWKFIG